MPEPTADLLAWLDLEMTGLDVERDVIVEVAVVVTDSDLRPRDAGLQVVVHHPASALDGMSDHVRAMHTRSGLLPEIARSSTSLEEAGAAVLAYLRTHVAEPRTVPLCGNSIGTDRRFLARYLPEVEEFLHYRSVDVSSLKELCRRWYPDAYRARPQKAEGHRALADVLESIDELRYYRETILRPPAASAPADPSTPPAAGAGTASR